MFTSIGLFVDDSDRLTTSVMGGKFRTSTSRLSAHTHTLRRGNERPREKYDETTTTCLLLLAVTVIIILLKVIY